MSNKSQKATYVRNFIFGVEDSLVSTVGLISGVAAVGVDRTTIFITGTILIFVEALSMGVGSVLTETSIEEFGLRKSDGVRVPRMGGLIMFVSYFLAGFVPLSPYLFFPVSSAFPASISASLIALFILGYVSARKFGANARKSSLRMLTLGGLAIFAGTAVGFLLKRFT
jgi:VIT1/CCC1 family predicted Fe2+/Mn2+ transporter